MLPDFPRIKKEWTQVFHLHINTLMNQDTVLSRIRRVHHFEGNRMAVKTVEGESEVSNYKLYSSKMEGKAQDIIEKGPKAFFEQAEKTAEELKRHQAGALLSKMDEISSKTGNVVDGQGQPFSPDLLLRVLEKVHIDFDDNGNPMMPTLMVSPELGERIKGKLPDWEKDLEHKKKFDELIERKRKEWNDRESHRKLVD